MASSSHRNIYIVGAQCTGKTTLVNALEEYFTMAQPSSTAFPRPAIIREVARSVLSTHAIPATDIRSSPNQAFQLQELILRAQVVAEHHALDNAGWFISDRSGVDPICYAFRYAGKEKAESLLASKEWDELEKRMAEALIVVCESGADWLTDDGVRLMPLDRKEWIDFHDDFCNRMEDLDLSHVVLPAKLTDLAARVEFVISRIHSCGERLEIPPVREHLSGTTAEASAQSGSVNEF